jgi:hypothetical protein
MDQAAAGMIVAAVLAIQLETARGWSKGFTRITRRKLR